MADQQSQTIADAAPPAGTSALPPAKQKPTLAPLPGIPQTADDDVQVVTDAGAGAGAGAGAAQQEAATKIEFEAVNKPHHEAHRPQHANIVHVPSAMGQPAVRKGTGKRRRRFCRLCCLLVSLGLAFGIYILAVFAGSVTETAPFDPRNELGIQVRGCDVNIFPGSTSKIKVSRWLGTQSTHKLTWNTAGTAVVNVVADNPEGCDALQFACARICTVDITTDPENIPQLIYVVQRADDDKTDHILVNVAKDTHLNAFRADGPTTEVYVTGATIDGSLTVRGQGAPVFITDTMYGSADLRAISSAVYLTNTKPTNRDIALSYRSTSNNMCISARSNDVAVVPDEAWQNPGAPWSACTLDNSWWARRTVTNYDTNNDFMISISEFGEGLTKLSKCCGSACPFRSLCGGLEAQVFPTSASSGDNTLSGRSGIVTDSEFLRRLKELNDTTLVPFCLAEALIDEGSATVSVPTKIMADGEIRIDTTTEAWSNPAKPDNSKEGSTLNTTFYTPPGRIPGLKLLKRDADRLTTELRDKYGDKDHVDDVFAIIDVAASPGVPSTRWLYTTRPFFLNLPPAHLQLLSAGLLVPPIKQYRVHFVGAECNENGTRYDGDSLFDEQARQVGIFQQLSTALTPRFQLEMRGVLVQVMPDHLPAPEGKHFGMFQRDFTSGGYTLAPFATANDIWARIAVWLSVAIGATLAVFTTVLFILYLRAALRQRQRKQDVRRRIMRLELLGSMGVEDPGEDEEEDADAHGKLFNPFETPLQLIEMLVLSPIRRSLTNSLKVFVRRHCKKAKVGESITLDELVQAYSRFCYQNELSEIHDRKELQRLVVTAEFDDDNDGDIDSETVVMPQGVTIERLRGIKWKKRWQPKRIEQRLQQEMIAFNAKQLAQVAANGGGAGDSSSSSSDSEDEHGRRVPMTLASGADGGVNVIAASGSTGTTQEMSEEALMFSFINKYCITSDKFTTTKDFIEVLDTKQGPGFHSLYNKHCAARGWAGPEVITQDLLSPYHVRYVKRRVIKLKHLGLRDTKSGERVKLGCRWYAFQAFTVLVHLLWLLLIPILIVNAAFSMQYMYAETTAAVPAVSFFDVMSSFPPDLGGRDMMIMVEVLVLAMFVYMVLAILRTAAYYMDSNCNCFNLFVRKAFAVVLTIFLFLSLSYAGVVSCWFILGAVLNPTQYLPYGMAVVTLGVVMAATWSAMWKAAMMLKTRIMDGFRKKLQETMNRARKAMIDQARMERQRESVAMLRRRNVAAAKEGVDVKDNTSQPFDIADIFALLERDGDGKLSHEEFHSIFEKLHINMSERKRKMIFAYCDKDGSGDISEEEFVDAWHWVEQQMVTEAAAAAGLSDGAIAIAIVTIAVLLIAIFAFIFIAIRAWNNVGGFDAVVQSFLVVGSGKMMTLAKKKPKSPEELDNMVDDLVDGADETAEPLPSM